MKDKKEEIDMGHGEERQEGFQSSRYCKKGWYECLKMITHGGVTFQVWNWDRAFNNLDSVTIGRSSKLFGHSMEGFLLSSFVSRFMLMDCLYFISPFQKFSKSFRFQEVSRFILMYCVIWRVRWIQHFFLSFCRLDADNNLANDNPLFCQHSV